MNREQLKAAMSLHSDYKVKKNNLEASLKAMRYAVVENPHFHWRKRDFLTDAAYLAAKVKDDESRRKAHREKLMELEKQLQTVEKNFDRELSKI